MATFSELQTKVQRRVIDLPATVTTEVPSLINFAIRELERKHSFRVMRTLLGPTTTTADTHTLVAVPTDFKEAHNKAWLRPNTGTAIPIQYAPKRLDVERHYDTGDEGVPAVILQSEPDDDGVRNFEVWPISNSASDYSGGEYRILIPYYRFLADLSAAGDDNWFTVHAEEYVIDRATAEGFALDWDTENEVKWLEKANAKARDAIAADKREALAGFDTLVPKWRGALQTGLDAGRHRAPFNLSDWFS